MLFALAVVLLAVPAWLLMNRGVWMVQTEGSPGGTILFVVAGGIGVLAGLAGLASAAAAVMALAVGAGVRGTVQGLSGFVVCLLLAASAAWGFTRDRATVTERQVRPPERPSMIGTGAAALAELREGLAPDLRIKREVADRAAYEECVLWLREPPKARQLRTCADGLLQAWDEAVASKRPFANMPEDGGGFPARLGALYVAYAEAADDAPAGLAGVTEVETRARARYPSDQATLEDLRLQREGLARRR